MVLYSVCVWVGVKLYSATLCYLSYQLNFNYVVLYSPVTIAKDLCFCLWWLIVVNSVWPARHGRRHEQQFGEIDLIQRKYRRDTPSI